MIRRFIAGRTSPFEPETRTDSKICILHTGDLEVRAIHNRTYGPDRDDGYEHNQNLKCNGDTYELVTGDVITPIPAAAFDAIEADLEQRSPDSIIEMATKFYRRMLKSGAVARVKETAYQRGFRPAVILSEACVPYDDNFRYESTEMEITEDVRFFLSNCDKL